MLNIFMAKVTRKKEKMDVNVLYRTVSKIYSHSYHLRDFTILCTNHPQYSPLKLEFSSMNLSF